VLSHSVLFNGLMSLAIVVLTRSVGLNHRNHELAVKAAWAAAKVARVL